MNNITAKDKDTTTKVGKVDKPPVEMPNIKKEAFKRGDKFSR